MMVSAARKDRFDDRPLNLRSPKMVMPGNTRVSRAALSAVVPSVGHRPRESPRSPVPLRRNAIRAALHAGERTALQIVSDQPRIAQGRATGERVVVVEYPAGKNDIFHAWQSTVGQDILSFVASRYPDASIVDARRVRPGRVRVALTEDGVPNSFVGQPMGPAYEAQGGAAQDELDAAGGQAVYPDGAREVSAQLAPVGPTQAVGTDPTQAIPPALDATRQPGRDEPMGRQDPWGGLGVRADAVNRTDLGTLRVGAEVRLPETVVLFGLPGSSVQPVGRKVSAAPGLQMTAVVAGSLRGVSEADRVGTISAFNAERGVMTVRFPWDAGRDYAVVTATSAPTEQRMAMKRRGEGERLGQVDSETVGGVTRLRFREEQPRSFSLPEGQGKLPFRSRVVSVRNRGNLVEARMTFVGAEEMTQSALRLALRQRLLGTASSDPYRWGFVGPVRVNQIDFTERTAFLSAMATGAENFPREFVSVDNQDEQRGMRGR